MAPLHQPISSAGDAALEVSTVGVFACGYQQLHLLGDKPSDAAILICYRKTLWNETTLLKNTEVIGHRMISPDHLQLIKEEFKKQKDNKLIASFKSL